jgi:hypothetical protein
VQSSEVHQNVMLVDANLTAPGAVRLNHTFDPDFVTNVGQLRKSGRNTLDIVAPAGNHRLEVRYRPRGFLPGAIATVLGVLVIVAAFVLSARLRRPTRGPA